MPGLPSPSQKMAQTLRDNAPGRVLKIVDSQVSFQTQSQIWRYLDQEHAFPRSLCRKCEEQEGYRLPDGGMEGGGQGLTSLATAPYPELQEEGT